MGDNSISYSDSHTGGEPTRVVTSGFPKLTGRTVAEKRDDLVARYQVLAQGLVAEPRASEATVAAIQVPSANAECVTGVIFVDAEAVLGMCGHGTIGLVETLRHQGVLMPGTHRIETPVGEISVVLNSDGSVAVDNVDSYRLAAKVTIEVPEIGVVTGDVAYGGNTFFCVGESPIPLDSSLGELLVVAKKVHLALHAAGYTDVDHVEFYGPPTQPDADSQNFVLCPSGTYDRSPCGTGTSAKLACLAADQTLAEGDTWVQESITGSLFRASYRWIDEAKGIIAPTITGSATVFAEGRLLMNSPTTLA